jgi:hypothetical protein
MGNKILEAYNAGKRVKRISWTRTEWIKKHSDTDSINDEGIIRNNDYSFDKSPEIWEILPEDIEPETETPPQTESYYGKKGMQPIDLIEAQELNFNLGNVVKYVCRAGKKDGNTTLQDLQKALDYLTREIKKHEK